MSSVDHSQLGGERTDERRRMQAKALARSRRRAMQQRARRLRRLVGGLGAALFTAAFVGIYVQLVSGHDPALSRQRTASATGSVAAKTTTAAKSSSGGETSSGSTSSSLSSGEESAGSSVTTKTS